MRRTIGAVFATALTAIVLGLGAPGAHAQRRVQLINFDATSWRYFTNGTDLPTQTGNAWRSRTFPDDSWPAGSGLLGVENVTYPYPFNTVFPAYDDTIITYYFRAHFTLAASDFIFPLTLVMSNLVDDGCVIYLNSNEVHRIRMPAGQNYTYLTPSSATQGGMAEGTYEPTVNISTNGLVVGDNVVAVEVHQPGAGSTDIVNGLSLTAIVPTALSITSQPPAQVSASIGSPFTLSAGVAGGPGLYQWQTNNGAGTFINLSFATNLSYTATPAALGTFVYRLVGSNGVNTAISSTSTVTVGFDTTGPYMLSAIVDETRPNRIVITWNERLNFPPGVCVPCATNFTVVSTGSSLPVTVASVQYNASGGVNAMPATFLTVDPANWLVGTNYYIIASWVRDLAGLNVMAPNSVIGVSWPLTVNTNVLDYNAAWEYHTDWALGDLTIYQQPWFATNYDTATNGHWGSGCGVFFKDSQINPESYVPCRGTLMPICSALGSYVRNPTLFRTTFVVPPALGTNVTLRISPVADDGYVLYLNGTEISRANVTLGIGALPDENTRSPNQVADATCYQSNNVSVVLMPGTNVVAAAVCQFNTEGANGGDTYWGLRLDLSQTSYSTGSVPSNGTQVRLTGTKVSTNQIRFTWPTNLYGYALEFTTNITTVGTTTICGPWYQSQTNMAIGMLTNYPPPAPGFMTGPAYIFRLRKVSAEQE